MKVIHPSQLRIGLYVHLDLSWMEHGFFSNNFKIKNEKQLVDLRKLGLKQIQYDPARSDVEPLPLQRKTTAAAEASSALSAEERQQQLEKAERQAKLRKRRQSLNRCEKAYGQAVGKVRALMQNIMSQPAMAVEAAGEMVGDMVGELMADQEATVHLVNMKGKSESSYFHSINVTILSLMLGKQLGLDKDALQQLGVGALFHDLGHTEIPGKILRKTTPLSKAEQDFFEMHPTYGVKLAERLGTLPPLAIEIIAQHHEMADGSGYPKGLKGEQIVQLARIVALVNAYDNLCNPLDSSKSLSPYEAMSLLFARQRARYDQQILTSFITHMGVYPPGTVVMLADGRTATVLSINPKSLLMPKVMVYEPSIPKSEALILDLQEEGIEIAESLRRSNLPQEVMDYLDLADNVNYIFDTNPTKA